MYRPMFTVVLLACCVFSLSGKRHSQQEDDAQKLGEASNTELGREISTIAKILTEEVNIEANTAQVEGSELKSKRALGEVLEVDTKADLDEFMTKYHEEMTNAIEEVSEEMEPEQAADKRMLITSALLQKINGETDTPEVCPADLGNKATVQGDMLFTTQDGASSLVENSEEAKSKLHYMIDGKEFWAGTLWPRGQVPFCYHPSISQDAQRGFSHAIQHVTNLVPCLTFNQVGVRQLGRDETGPGGGICQSGGIFVQSLVDGCFSFVGYLGQYQQLNLGRGCESMGIAAHELLHALGMAHEQARTDYNQNIKIYWQNIQPDMASNYNTDAGADLQQPYDLMSLMHYGDSDFGIGGAKTMAPRKQHKGIMGNRMGMTKLDVMQLATMYSCKFHHMQFDLCTNNPAECGRERCTCHQDPATTESFMAVQDRQGCWRCKTTCMGSRSGQCSISGDCECGALRKLSLRTGNGAPCFQCEER